MTPSSLLSTPPRARAVAVIAASLFAVHMLLAGRYGVFRDEMYYVACGEHLAFGYVDHPPLVALMARAAHPFGDSIYALRFVPALCAAAMVLLTGELARVFRGGAFAQALAALCVAVAPEMLGTFHFLSMNCVLPVTWTAAALLMAHALRRDDVRLWIAFGLVCGVSLLAKHSTLFFGAGLAVGLVATPHRRVLATRGPWIAVAVAALVFAPNVAWEVTHGWPTLEFMQNAQTRKMVQYGPGAFLGALSLTMLPTTLPIWGGGLAWLLFAKEARAHRFLGIAFASLVAIVIAGHGKPYYVAGGFPIVYAAGAAAIEARLARPLARAAIAGVVALSGALLAPLAIPLLAPEVYVQYAAILGVSAPADEKHAVGPLPQHFADQFGWEAMAEQVAHVYEALPPEEQRVAAIYADNYGEAGAIDYFGARWRLPRATSGHNAYFMWGPPTEGRGAVLVSIGVSREDLLEAFDDVEQVAETSQPYAMPFENHAPICVARHPKRPLSAMWANTKHYI